MEQQFIDTLKKVVDEKGKDALINAKKCKAFLSDYTGNEYKKERRLLVQAVEAGVAKAIDTAEDLSACRTAQARYLEEDYGLNSTVAATIVDTLTLVLRGDTAKLPAPVAPSPAVPKNEMAFKRPDKFSKEQLRSISIIHDEFARLTMISLSAQLRLMINIHVASVDQLTTNELIRSIPTPIILAIIDMDPLKGYAVLEMDYPVTFSIIDRLFGGTGEGTKSQHELNDFEKDIVKGVIEKILGNMQDAWTQVIDLRPRLFCLITSPSLLAPGPPSNMWVLVTLKIKISNVEGLIRICIPYSIIEPIIDKLSTL